MTKKVTTSHPKLLRFAQPNYVLSPMIVIVNITRENNEQNFNLTATINCGATVYENNIRQIFGKNYGNKSGKNYGLNSC